MKRRRTRIECPHPLRNRSRRKASNSGFQEDDDSFTWESAAVEAALDNSLFFLQGIFIG
jgi:hypothetical protein